MSKVVYTLKGPSNCEMQSVIIDGEAVSRLQGKHHCIEERWLCDQCVNGILTTVVEQEMNIYVFSTYMYERLRRDAKSACESALSRKEIFLKKAKWLIPACINSHWTAAVVDVERHVIIVLDSLHKHQLSFTEKVIEFANYFLPHNGSEWTIHYDQENVPLQPNKYDCGVLMLKALENHVTKERVEIDPMSCTKYRQQFLDSIKAKSIQQHSSPSKPHSPLKPDSVSNQPLNHCQTLNSSLKPKSLVKGDAVYNQAVKNSFHKECSTTCSSSPSKQSKCIKILHSGDSQSIQSSTNTSPSKPQFHSIKVDNISPCGLDQDSTSQCQHQQDSPTLDPDSRSWFYLKQGTYQPNAATCVANNPKVDHRYNISMCTPVKQSDQSKQCIPPCSPPKYIPYNSVLNWNQLPTPLQYVLPPHDEYSYVVETYQEIDGAKGDSPHFTTTVRINLNNEQHARKWIDQMSNHSTCTYRTTKTVKTCNKRVKCKFVQHCQHFAKKPSQKQAEASTLSSAKRIKPPLKSQVRNKKTNCPSSFTLVIQIPTKTQTRKADSQPHFLTHCGVLKMTFNHNHAVKAAHTLSFRDVSAETKKELTDLFEMGHNASSARHAHEQRLLYEVESNQQEILADRAQNPNPQDVCRLYHNWRLGSYGNDNGKGLFEKLQEAIDKYNTQNENEDEGGRAVLQWYDSGQRQSAEVSDTDSEEMKPVQKKRKVSPTDSTPMIIGLCTPIMRRAHQYVQQSRDIVFVDATSSFDRLNTSIFVLSTVMPAGAVPLGIIVTSDEREETIIDGLQCLASILPQNAFFGKGPLVGPSMVMIDDSNTERNALTTVWKSATTLLCTFHFLQRRWTWLHDSKNGVRVKEHRMILIKKVKDLVYAETEDILEKNYLQLQQCETTKCYPQFLTHLESLWPRRKEWAHCYRRQLLLRGNHTNNYAEAGMKIMKELIFSRVKAYNMVQVFHFLSETLESYYCRKLVSVANNRLDTYIAVRFQGLNASKIPKESVVETDNKNVFKVKSITERDVVYTVDMTVGICTCRQGMDGSPCSHQAAVAIHHGKESINCIPTLAPTIRQIYAQIALGEKADKNPAFYASLHDKELRTKMEVDMFNPDFLPPTWDIAQSEAKSDNCLDDSERDLGDMLSRIQATSSAIDKIAEDLKQKLGTDEQLLFATEKFISRYELLKGSIPQLSSSLHRFGWTFGGSVTSRKGGHLRHGRRISVQATAAGRRKGAKSRGKARATPGKPAKWAKDEHSTKVYHSSRYHIPTRRAPKQRRPHFLQSNIEKGQQNAGKW